MLTRKQLVQRNFGVPLKPARWQFTRYDRTGCMGYVGLDERQVAFTSKRFAVAAISFVVVREDLRRRGIGMELMQAAHMRAIHLGLPYAVLFTDVPDFYRVVGYVEIRPRAMVRRLAGPGWPPGQWEVVGEEW